MSDTASRFDRTHLTDLRHQAQADGEDVHVELHITTLDPHDPGEICRLCPTPAAMLVEIWQSYRRDGRDLRDLTDTYDPLCAGCVEAHAPGLLAAVRHRETIEDAYRAGPHDADAAAVAVELTAYDDAIAAEQAAASGALVTLGFDDETSAKAIEGLASTTIISTKMLGSRIIGPYVPGGEITFMADDADPDGPLGDVSRNS